MRGGDASQPDLQRRADGGERLSHRAFHAPTITARQYWRAVLLSGPTVPGNGQSVVFVA
ncbi:protein of unknown function [Denitratisoma oestradiolicum]|uniref:Uncharacterized protein n=1 Tax=Denitratisoma oestradiolicum TaxID=311182 RepID=A0A6S6XPG0_9PROT|nr:protein of unknown function [Denitratisoma oestradiolicum]